MSLMTNETRKHHVIWNVIIYVLMSYDYGLLTKMSSQVDLSAILVEQ